MSSGSFVDDDRFDGLYLNVAQTTRGIEPLLDSVFSFLRRKTDFFAGPPGSDNGTEAAIEKVNETVRKHAEIYLRQQEEKSKKKQKKAATALKKPKEPDEVIEMDAQGGFDVSSAEAEAEPAKKPAAPSSSAKVQEKKPETPTTKPVAAEKKKDGDDDDEEDQRGPPPVGNGGTVEGKYVWTQTLSEVTVNAPVPANTRGRDLNVTIAKRHLKVGLRSQQDKWIVDAPLTKPIICDDSFWTVEDGNRIVINLQKLNQMEWWDTVCEGDPKIDVRTIQPENSSIGDLDGETRKTVEKMMYDQRQKALGLPTSEEEEKLAMLERFKQQHPELDFSNAKIN